MVACTDGTHSVTTLCEDAVGDPELLEVWGHA